jgi:hypothetical protein
MSIIPSAQEIELQLSLFDVQVRGAIQDGKIIEYMARHHHEIVSAFFVFFFDQTRLTINRRLFIRDAAVPRAKP